MNHMDDTVPIDPPERRTDVRPSLAAPSFDARSVRRARAAVPLEREEAGWNGKLPWIVVALVAGMIGGLLGIWALSYYQSADDTTRAASNSPTPAATSAPPAASPAAAQVEAAAKNQTARTSDQPPVEAAAALDAEEASSAGAASGASPASADEERELRGALSGWIDATNARDLERQMSFYDSRVGAFYLTRNVSRGTVRAEKEAVISRASRVEVRADPPQIFLSRDGSTATMRFRKQFAIEGGGIDRRGAVLQELRWRRTQQGWKIVGERDLRIID